MENTDQFGAKAGVRAHSAGHHSKHSSIGERDDRAQELLGLAFRKSDHRLAHDWDAHFVGETSGNFFAVNKSHRSASYSSALSFVCSIVTPPTTPFAVSEACATGIFQALVHLVAKPDEYPASGLHR